MMSKTSIIDCEQVTLIRSGTTLLDGINWQVAAGEHWAVLGRNGSGKTLTLRVISGYLFPSSGTVEVLGHRFGASDLRELRKEIGWVSLDIQYEFHRGYSVFEVILSGPFGSVGLNREKPTEEHIRKAEELLDEFEIRSIRERQFHTLSDGEQKRTLICRALLGEPKLLILDEPCNGLDIKSREEFLTAISSLASKPNGPGFVYVTHHIDEIMPFISHALLLRRGKVQAAGAKDEVLTSHNISETFDLPVEMHEKNGRYAFNV